MSNTGYALKFGYIKDELAVMDGAEIVAQPGGRVITTDQGDLITQNAAGTTVRLEIGNTDQVLRVNAAGTDPEWGAVDLSNTNAVEGTLPVARGGTNATSFTGDRIIASDNAGTTLVTTVSPVIDTVRSDASGNPVVLDIVGDNAGPEHVSVNNGTGEAVVSVTGTATDANLVLQGKGAGRVALGNAELLFPNTVGIANQVLATDGVGSLVFLDVPVYETGDLTTGAGQNGQFVSVPGASVPTPLVANSVYQAQVRVVAKEVGSNTNYATFDIHASFLFDGTNLTKIAEDNQFSPFDSTLQASINAVSGEIVTQVRSNTNTAVKWSARLSFDVVSD